MARKFKKEQMNWKEVFTNFIFMHKKKFPHEAMPYLGYEWSYTKKGAQNIASNHTHSHIRHFPKYKVWVVYVRI